MNPFVDLERFQHLVPGLQLARTLSAGHFSPVEAPAQIYAMRGPLPTCAERSAQENEMRRGMKQKLLDDKIVVVTGASRGIGKGIATQLGKYGATVYVTGRTLSTSSNASSGTINGVAEEVTAAGGKGVAVACDHSDDDQI